MMPLEKPPAVPASESALQQSISLLEATLEATAEGLLIVDLGGRIVRFNRRFAQMWALSEETLAGGDDDAALKEAVSRVSDPAGFIDRVRYLYDHPSEQSRDTFALVDGRIFERFSLPHLLDDEIVGRVWSFRDISDRVRAERELRESEARYRRLFEESPHATYVTSPEGHFVEANPALFQMLGLTAADLPRANSLTAYVNPEDRDELIRLLEEQGTIINHPVQLRGAEGQTMDCLLTSTLQRDARGEVTGYHGIIKDVTAQVRAERALRESEMKFRSLIEHATDTITVLDPGGNITYESPSLLRVLGYTPEMMIGRNVFEFVHPDDQPTTMQAFQRLATEPGQLVHVEVRFLHGEGIWRVLEVIGRNALDDPAVRGIVVNARDVTERKEAESRLLYDAFHDKLTRLPNRALMMDRMTQFLRRSRRADAPSFAVLFLDLDRFKVVNDSLGHMVGDQLLIATARRLEKALRPGDTVARIGGDEFAILLDDTSLEEARLVADRVYRDFQSPFAIDSHEMYVTASIGITMSGAAYRHPEEMLRDADIAMYHAKDSGRARYALFDDSMREAAVRQLELETDLRRAVERDEFEMVYQPIVQLADGALHGFEALIRWNHPQQGVLQPAEFTRLAEDTGLIVPMGLWVIRDVCRQLRRWSDAHGDAARRVHVNVSAHQIVRPEFIAQVSALLEEAGTPPHLLHLELTESTMMANAESSTIALRDLKKLGIGLSIDDFGTGYSSLSYLYRLPTDSVKIDRSFISQMGPGALEGSIVRTIVDLAHDLKMLVVAEGIETEEQAAALRGMRCECAQGFHYSKPVSAAEATEMIAARKSW